VGGTCSTHAEEKRGREREGVCVCVCVYTHTYIIFSYRFWGGELFYAYFGAQVET
jgi:hypothetical protein